MFCIEFYDNGIPFDDHVLSLLGKQYITTHENEGGSGIGLMNTIDILKHCHASFIIDERLTGNSYKKKVSICFDSLGEYRVYTNKMTLIEKLI